MTDPPNLLQPLLDSFRGVWTPERLATLSRISLHRRQFEGWWKFELATFLWEFAAAHGAYVFIESHNRADITVATSMVIKGALYPNASGPVCIPIELKTIGTWWGSCPSAISKALQGAGKKPLAKDLSALAGRRRSFTPFGLVALLITDAEGDETILREYEAHASRLAAAFELNEVMNLALALPSIPDVVQPLARQLIWAAW